MANGKGVIDFKNFEVLFAIGFKDRHTASTKSFVNLITTSEENSFGLAGGRWFDGNVQCHSMYNVYCLWSPC